MTNHSDFGGYLAKSRLAAGLGLRTFASLIGQRPSTVSAVEAGTRKPWQTNETLTRVAEALYFAPDSPQAELLYDLANPHRESNSGSQDVGDWPKKQRCLLASAFGTGERMNDSTSKDILNHVDSWLSAPILE